MHLLFPEQQPDVFYKKNPATLSKRASNTGVFLWILPIFSEDIFWRTFRVSHLLIQSRLDKTWESTSQKETFKYLFWAFFKICGEVHFLLVCKLHVLLVIFIYNSELFSQIFAIFDWVLNTPLNHAECHQINDQCSPSYRNHSIDLQYKSIDWFLYDEEHWSLMD